MASDSQPDSALNDDFKALALVAAGDQEALAELYDRYASVLVGVGLKILKDKDEVDALLHEVFVEIWQKAGSYDPKYGTVKAWLCLQMCNRGLLRSGLQSTSGASA